MNTDVRWGILGPGSIARRFAGQLPSSATGRLVAVASRDGGRAAAFADEFGADRSFDSYEALLADPEVDAVYIATPHTRHAEWVIKAARAGKHILCEKPLAPSPAFAMAAVDAAKENGVALLEAYMYRFHPQIVRVLDLVATGAIGRIQHVEAGFAFAIPRNDGRLFRSDLAGGGILDVGCYPASLAVEVAFAREDAPTVAFHSATGELVSGVDGDASARVRIGGVDAVLRTSVIRDLSPAATISCEDGTIDLPDAWGERDVSATRIVVHPTGAPSRVIDVPPVQPMAAEADAVSMAIATGRREAPEMPWAHTRAIARLLTDWRAAVVPG